MEPGCTYMEPYISGNNTDEVFASCIVGPEYFWCQSASTPDLNMVVRLAQAAGRAQQNAVVPQTLGCGSPCLARFSSDNQWYRAQVISRTQSTVSVVFVDYGNESEVDISDIRSLPPNLLDLPPLAFLCSLKGFEPAQGCWDDDVYDEFYNFLVDKQVKVTVYDERIHPDMAIPQYAVAIKCDGLVVNAAVQKYWKPNPILRENTQKVTLPQDDQVESHAAPLVNVNTFAYKEPSISQNKSQMVYASCIVEPKFFWCQYADTKCLSQISKLAQEAGQAEQDVTFAKTLGPGSPCLALFSSDSQWHRAQVMSRTNDTFNVVFVDYGNESEVDVKDVRPLPPALLEQAPQAFLCCLRGFDESEGSWDDCIYDEFYSILVDKLLKVSVFSVETYSEVPKCPQYAVEIEYKSAPLSALLQKYWKPAAKECMTGSHHTETVLQETYMRSNNVSDMSGPSANAAKMNGRSISAPSMNGTSISSSKMNGTSSNSSKMNGMNINTSKMNGMSISVPSTNGTSNKTSKMNGTSINSSKMNGASINEASMNGASTNVPSMNGTSINASKTNGTSISVSKVNGTSINMPKTNGNTCKYKEPKISQNMTAMVYASCISEPNYFWCQFDTDDLSKVSDLAQKAGRAEQDVTFPKTLGRGSPCLALFSTDNQWYRAQVISRNGSTLHVVFVDYGNESEVDVKDVRSLTQSLLDEAPRAFLCSLKGFDQSEGSWDDGVYDDFYSVLVDKLLKVSISNMEEHSDMALPQYSVDVECEGVDVGAAMGKYWKGSLTPDLKKDKTT